MPSVELSDQQVVDLIKKLPPRRMVQALISLARGVSATAIDRMERAEDQLRRIASERQLDWDTLSDSERESLVDDLLHEDRPCT